MQKELIELLKQDEELVSLVNERCNLQMKLVDSIEHNDFDTGLVLVGDYSRINDKIISYVVSAIKN